MADHKTDDIQTVDATLAAERVKSVAVIVAALYFVLNTVLSALNINPLPFTNEDVATAVSSVGAVVMTVVVWWRQNVMTRAASDGHKLTVALKNGQVTAVQGTGQPPADITDDDAPADDVDVERDPVTGTPVIHVGA